MQAVYKLTHRPTTLMIGLQMHGYTVWLVVLRLFSMVAIIAAAVVIAHNHRRCPLNFSVDVYAIIYFLVFDVISIITKCFHMIRSLVHMRRFTIFTSTISKKKKTKCEKSNNYIAHKSIKLNRNTTEMEMHLPIVCTKNYTLCRLIVMSQLFWNFMHYILYKYLWDKKKRWNINKIRSNAR